jgi:hypothetical protein
VLEKAIVLKCTPGEVLLQEGHVNRVGVYIMLSGSVFMAEGSKKIAQGSLNGKRYVIHCRHHLSIEICQRFTPPHNLDLHMHRALNTNTLF